MPVAKPDIKSSRGWMLKIEKPEKFKDITNEGAISLSSVSYGGGVDELLHDSSELAWRTNLRTPHQAVVTFARKTNVCYIMLYLDYVKDESYCPQEVRINLGWGSDQWSHRIYKKIQRPSGWVKIRLFDGDCFAQRVMALQMTIIKNHEKGRDCVIRHFRVLGPINNRYDAMNRLVLGDSGILETAKNAEKTRALIMKNYFSIR